MIQIETLAPYKIERIEKPKLLVDIDGVIAKYDYKQIVKEYFGVDIDEKTVYAQDMADVLGVTHKEIDTMFHKQVFGKANLLSGALKVLGDLSNRYQIIIYTNRTKYMTPTELVTWLVENEIPFEGIEYEPNQMYSAHIDDSPAKLASTHSELKILFSQPWNTRTLDIHKRFLRVASWSEIRRFL